MQSCISRGTPALFIPRQQSRSLALVSQTTFTTLQQGRTYKWFVLWQTLHQTLSIQWSLNMTIQSTGPLDLMQNEDFTLCRITQEPGISDKVSTLTPVGSGFDAQLGHTKTGKMGSILPFWLVLSIQGRSLGVSSPTDVISVYLFWSEHCTVYSTPFCGDVTIPTFREQLV